jgi:hypothetical protein
VPLQPGLAWQGQAPASERARTQTPGHEQGPPAGAPCGGHGPQLRLRVGAFAKSRRVRPPANPPDPVALDKAPFPERGPNLKARLPNLPPMINSRHTGPGGQPGPAGASSFPVQLAGRDSLPNRGGTAGPAPFFGQIETGECESGMDLAVWPLRKGRPEWPPVRPYPSAGTAGPSRSWRNTGNREVGQTGAHGRVALRIIAPTPRLHQE